MQVFITKKKGYSFLEEEGIIVESSTDNLKKYLLSKDTIAYDKETTGLDPFKAQPLLTQFGDPTIQYALDETSIPLIEIADELSTCKLVGHNIKFDYKHSKMNNFIFRNLYDTMIAEQVIAKGSGLWFNLSDVVQRRLQIAPLNKDIRDTFVGKNPDTPFTSNQIIYGLDDVKVLLPLKEEQEIFIKKYGYEKDLYDIEFPYLSIVADAELEGFFLNEKNWRILIAEGEALVIEYKNKLNSILRDLRVDYPALSVLRINRKVKKNKAFQGDMFADDQIITAPVKSTMNYGSQPQILRIFDLLDLPKPTTLRKNKETHKKEEVDSVGAEALEAYLIEHSGSILDGFLRTLIKHGEATTAVSTFGDRFLVERLNREKGKKPKLGYKRHKTGKIYTVYRQCGTETTRLASGAEKEGLYNSQNIPKQPKYRNCFLADPGCCICTIDLSGAELKIAASLSGDPVLIDLFLTGDVHSALADYSYNEITKFITSCGREWQQREELEFLYKASAKKLEITNTKARVLTKQRVDMFMSTGRFEITKKSAYDIRDKFKNVNYSIIYGGGADRIMDILSIGKDYAEIIEKALKQKLPTLFSFLEGNGKFGLEHGYVRFNDICGGRHWFKDVLESKKNGYKLSYTKKGEIERACKNYPIQGTQGQMLKEATVRYYYDHVYPQKLDIRPKLWVHDEHVAQFPWHYEDPRSIEQAKILQKYMNEVSTSYLTGGLTMLSEYNLLPYWTK